MIGGEKGAIRVPPPGLFCKYSSRSIISFSYFSNLTHGVIYCEFRERILLTRLLGDISRDFLRFQEICENVEVFYKKMKIVTCFNVLEF